MKEVSPYVALSQETWARFSTRFAIASFVEAGWFSERCPRLFARVHILWFLYSLVGSRLQMFSRSYNQCYLRPALIWQHELVGVASELVMLRLFVFGTKRIASEGFSCDWAFPVMQDLRYTFVFSVFPRITWSGALLVAFACFCLFWRFVFFFTLFVLLLTSLPPDDRDVWLAVVFSPLGGFLSPVFFFFWVERHSLLGWICALWFVVCSWYG